MVTSMAVISISTTRQEGTCSRKTVMRPGLTMGNGLEAHGFAMHICVFGVANLLSFQPDMQRLLTVYRESSAPWSTYTKPQEELELLIRVSLERREYLLRCPLDSASLHIHQA